MAIKRPEPVFQVHDQELQADHTLRRLLEPGHDPGQAVSSLAYTKAAFNSVALTTVLSLSSFFLPAIERRTAQRRPAQPDAMFLAEGQVASAAVDLICQDCFRIVAVALFVIFRRLDQVATFVESIPAEVINEGVSVNHADRNFGSKLGRRPGLSSHYRANMGLRDADDTVFDLVRSGLIHLILLLKEDPDGFQFSYLPVAQAAVAVKL